MSAGSKSATLESGYQRAITDYSHTEFWNKVMSELEDLGLLPASTIAQESKIGVSNV